MQVNAYDVQVIARFLAMLGVGAGLIAMIYTSLFVTIVMPNAAGWITLSGYAVALSNLMPIALFCRFLLGERSNHQQLAIVNGVAAVVVLAFVGWCLTQDRSPDPYLYGPYLAEGVILIAISIEALLRKKDYL